MLAKFPKNRPNGNIWIGSVPFSLSLESFNKLDQDLITCSKPFRKHRMVLKVTDRRRGQLLDDLEREKKNAFFCLHPAVDKVCGDEMQIGNECMCQND